MTTSLWMMKAMGTRIKEVRSGNTMMMNTVDPGRRVPQRRGN